MTQPSSGDERPGRYGQCDDTCTVDCGHCKGSGRPSSSDETAHDDACESEFIEGPMVYSPCRCAERKDAERFWRDRVADEIADIERYPAPVTPGMEPEDYAESVGRNGAIDEAIRVARGGAS